MAAEVLHVQTGLGAKPHPLDGKSALEDFQPYLASSSGSQAWDPLPTKERAIFWPYFSDACLVNQKKLDRQM